MFITRLMQVKCIYRGTKFVTNRTMISSGHGMFRFNMISHVISQRGCIVTVITFITSLLVLMKH